MDCQPDLPSTPLMKPRTLCATLTYADSTANAAQHPMRYLVPSQEVHARLDQVTVPGLDDTEAPPRKAPAKELGQGGRRRSHPDAKPPAKEARLRADESVARV